MEIITRPKADESPRICQTEPVNATGDKPLNILFLRFRASFVYARRSFVPGRINKVPLSRPGGQQKPPLLIPKVKVDISPLYAEFSTMRKIAYRLLILAGLLVAGLGLTSVGCKSGGKSKDDHMPAAGHPEETADSTRLDAAEVDTFQEATTHPETTQSLPADTISPR
jgi:hypothetical protein